MFTIILLIKNIYIMMPLISPINTYPLKFPLLNVKMLYKIMIPVKIQNTMSLIYVIKSVVLKLCLSILKMSNKSPILIPVKINITKLYNSFKKIASFCTVNLIHLLIIQLLKIVRILYLIAYKKDNKFI